MRATGGGAFFDEELVVEVERRRSEGGVGLTGIDFTEMSSLSEASFVNSDTDEPGALKGGGSLRVPLGVVRGGGVKASPLGVARGTVTQSGS